MLKAVIDSNVFVSAVLAVAGDYWNDARALFQNALVEDRSFESVTSFPMMDELADVLSRPEIGVSPAQAIDTVDLVLRASTVVNIYGVPMGVRDSDDDKVVETAMNADADVIVTRDLDLHDPRASYSIAKTGIGIRSRPIRVIDVRAFLREIGYAGGFSLLMPATPLSRDG